MAFSVRDRSYGPPPMNRMTVGVKWLLIVNCTLFLLYFFSAGSAWGRVFAPFALVPNEVVGRLAIWLLVTFRLDDFKEKKATMGN